MKLIGLDYVKFAQDFCESRKQDIKVISSSTESDNLFYAILGSPIDSRLSDGRVTTKTSIHDMLRSPEERAYISQMGQGAYHTEATVDGVTRHIMIVDFLKAKREILKDNVYAGYTPSRLVELASRNPYFIRLDDSVNEAIRLVVKDVLPPKPHWTNMAVYDITDMIDAISAQNSAQVAKRALQAPKPPAANINLKEDEQRF